MKECDQSNSSSSKAEKSSDTTLLPPIITSSPLTHQQFTQAELLWNQFIENITKRQRWGTGMCKYPNPEVPEFYPRNMKIVCTEVSHETGDSPANEARPATCTTINTLQQNLEILDKNEILLTRMSQQCVGVQPTFVEAPETVHGIAHYYWTFHDPNPVAFERPDFKRIPHTIQFNLNAADKQTDLTIATCKEPISESEASTRSLHDLTFELHTKNQQLVHMNNVVKALLEEIYRINELLMRNKTSEQAGITREIYASVEQYLKTANELDYPCDDCCTRLKELVSHVSKQLERKIAKQHGQYRSSFVDCILSVIENSLHTLTLRSQIDEDTKKQLRKQDAYTQTNNNYFYFCEEPFAQDYVPVSSQVDSHRGRQHQMTRVYRNRNFYKYDIANEAANSNWYPNAVGGGGGIAPGRAMSRNNNNRIWRTNNALSFPQRKRVSTATRLASSSELENSRNPVQLIHQRFKNLNCRLEGIPEKKLVKFSYIVDNKEYSAIATTKKEAQYLCAWYMLNSCKE